MKTYHFLLFLIITFNLSAQTEDNQYFTTTPGNYKIKDLSKVIEKYDSNKNGTLEIDEKKNVLEIRIDGKISNAELLQFSNVESLSVSGSNLETINLSDFKNLKMLFLQSNFNLKNLIAEDLAQLSQVRIDGSPIEILRIDKSNNILVLAINKANLNSINLNSLQDANSIEIYNSNLNEVFVDALVNLKYLHLDGNAISTINLPHSTTLETVSLNTNQLTDIDLQYVPNLVKLKLSENKISNIDISKLSNIVYLELTQNNLTSFKTENNTKLASIFLEKNKLTNLDLSNWIGFRDYEAVHPQILYIHYNPLKTMNIKNGKLTRVFCDKESLSKIKIIKDSIDDLAPKS